MLKNIFLLVTLAFSLTNISAQEIEKKWQSKNASSDFLELKEGTYNLKLASDSIAQNGDYLVQDKFLFLFENDSDSPTKRFVIDTKTDSTLTLKKGDKAYSFLSSPSAKADKLSINPASLAGILFVGKTAER